MNLKHSPRLIYCAGWATAGLYNAGREVFDTPWKILMVYNVSFFAIWALLGLVTLRLLRRYPLRMHWAPWCFHIVLAVLLTQIDVTFGVWCARQILGSGSKHSLAEVAVHAFKSCFHLGFMHYWIFVGIIHAINAQKISHARKLQVVEHKTAFIRAQLQSLKTQLQPHFLFNTLHSIASLMHYDVPTADRMLNRLSELLRISLRETGSAVVSLKKEMGFIEAYLEIEKIRFEQRLAVTWIIPDDLHDSPIPPFILQPLVENAIKYGVAPRAAGGSIVIRAYTESDALMLEVEDDAPEALPQQEKGFGIGLSNTRSRLETLYGVGQRFELIRSGMGTIARIRLPLPLFEQRREMAAI